MTKESPITNDGIARRVRGSGFVFLWLIFLVLSAASVKAEIKVDNLDWEPACEGSNVEVISQNGQILFIEASVQHFAEAREWTCAYKDGVLLSACYRHYLITRKPKGEEGEFELESKLDRIETFAAERGVIPKMPADLKKDFDEVIRIVRESLKTPKKP